MLLALGFICPGLEASEIVYKTVESVGEGKTESEAIRSVQINTVQEVTGNLVLQGFDQTLALDQSSVAERSRLTAIFVARHQSRVVTYESGLTRVTWDRFSPHLLDTAFSEIFESLGYRSIDSAAVEYVTKGQFNVSRFEEEYVIEGNISSETLSDAFDAISNKIPLLLIAKLDVGAPIKALENENPMVILDLAAHVYRYDGLFYETVASYGPASLLTDNQAKSEAILDAARSAARQLGAQLQQNNFF